jgi:hypothetical protein
MAAVDEFARSWRNRDGILADLRPESDVDFTSTPR